MPTPVEMPKPGNTVEDCLLTKWLKAKGEPVSEGETIAEIETDKATFDVPAPASGVLLEVFFEEGALVPVFARICVIGEPGERVEGFAPKQAAASTPIIEAPRPEPARVTVERSGETFASPRARRFAAEHGIETDRLTGSGPGGRVLEQDVRESVDRAAALPPIRQKIAARLRESLSQTAQYTLHGSADATALVALRARIKTGATPQINLNDLVLFCAVRALIRMPQLNAELKGGELRRSERVHLGFAADTERGLMVPVIRNADRLTLAELASSAKDLASRAASGAIGPDDLSGATFTVSNLGALGIEAFTPILNAPQVAILGVGSIELRHVRRNGRIELVDRIGLSLTCDHQVIDGAPGARFLAVVGKCIEDVEALSGIAS